MTTTHNAALAKIGSSTRKVTANIAAVFARATEDDILAGKVWYAEAQSLARELSQGGDITLDQAAVVIAHLSPQTPWSRNVAAARSLVFTGSATGVLGASVARAMVAMTTDDPFTTFGKSATKTRNFAANILGDEDAVTVDVWAARVAGVDVAALSRVGVYEAVAHCYRTVAKRTGYTPAQVQAITWVVIRGGRAA